MLNKKETLAIIFTLLFATACMGTVRMRMREHSKRILCSANLKNIGQAMMVYRNDYDGHFPKKTITDPSYRYGWEWWAQNTPGWQNRDKDWSHDTQFSVGSALYLLVRNTDIPTSAFVCPSNVQTPYDGTNSHNLELTELWDFGNSVQFPHTGPANCVSYAYQYPVGNRSTSKLAPPDFAVMADKNPWFDSKLYPASSGISAESGYNLVRQLPPYWLSEIPEYMINMANSYPHDRTGQYVLFADAHVNFEKTSDVGINHDNIYTPQYNSNDGDERAIRTGTVPMNSWPSYYQPYNSVDSFLINDDHRP